MKIASKWSREGEIARLRERLSRGGYPRLEMLLIIALAGGAGLLGSIVLLRLGVTVMAVRYPLAVLAGYGVFLLMLRVWLYLKAGSMIGWSGPDVTGIDLPGGGSGSGWSGFGGGSSGGGGATDSWGSAMSVAPGGDSGGGGWLSDLDLDEGWLVVLGLLAILGAAAAGVYVIYSAPALLAEILLDSLLLAGLYRKVRSVEPRHWLVSAFRLTWLPVLAVIVMFAIAGYLLQLAAPEARTIGDVFR